MIYQVDVRSPYVDEVDNGIRSFEVEADTLVEARELAEQAMCVGKETLIQIKEAN